MTTNHHNHPSKSEEIKRQRKRLLWLFVILFVVLMLIWSFGSVAE